MTYFQAVQLYCPRCGSELEGEGEKESPPRDDVVFVGKQLPPQLPSIWAYLSCDHCGWSCQGVRAFHQFLGAIDELERA